MDLKLINHFDLYVLKKVKILPFSSVSFKSDYRKRQSRGARLVIRLESESRGRTQWLWNSQHSIEQACI
jgi:hypothetical protein